jgi:hypothetical protein
MPETTPVRLFLSYSHKDESLREALGDHLAGLQREGVIDVWHDRKISAGQEWAGAIDSNLEEADIVLCLVSAGFLASPYCNDKELRRALERHDAGEACVIPVILRPVEWSGSPLGRLQALPSNAKPVTSWSNRDTAYKTIAAGIKDVALKLAERPKQTACPAHAPAISGGLNPPGAAADRSISSPPRGPSPTVLTSPATTPGTSNASDKPNPAAALEIPEGPVRYDSAFYIHPADEARWCFELDKPGALIRIKSPKGFGKSSLTARLMAYASGKGYRTATLNLERTDQKFFTDPELFMQWFCAAVGKGLGLQIRVEEYWNEFQGANDNGNDFFEKYLLKPDPTPLVLAIDNFDRIFAHAAIETDFCGLLRSWYEGARSNSLWERFRLVLSHSQESYLQKDINQSPFNVGLPVELGEMSPEQVHHLIALHGLTLSEAEVGQLLDLVGGHPYLVRKALFELANGMPFTTFLREAPTEAGVYSDHLRGILKAVEDHPDLKGALGLVVNSTEPVKLRSELAFKLESLGVLIPEGNLERPRCRLYADYLADRLAA